MQIIFNVNSFSMKFLFQYMEIFTTNVYIFIYFNANNFLIQASFPSK
jgi:hypothetical protein